MPPWGNQALGPAVFSCPAVKVDGQIPAALLPAGRALLGRGRHEVKGLQC